MTFELNAGKLLGLFAPLWLLFALSLAVNWDDWAGHPLAFAWVGGLPFALTGLFWMLGRRRWRLELTPTELIHHTVGRTQRFEWARMGPIEIDGVPGLDLVAPATLRFGYAGEGVSGLVGGVLGYRLLCVFGDGGARRLKREIEDYRRLHAGA